MQKQCETKIYRVKSCEVKYLKPVCPKPKCCDPCCEPVCPEPKPCETICIPLCPKPVCPKPACPKPVCCDPCCKPVCPKPVCPKPVCDPCCKPVCPKPSCCDPCGPNRCEITRPESFLSQLDGCNEVPPTNSAAVGTLVGLLSVDHLRFDFALETNGLANIASANFHLGPRCQNGPIVRTIPINFANGSAVGVWSSFDPEPLTPPLVEELKKGNIYVNIHTAQFPSGEIRGQIYPAKIKINK